MTRVSIVIPVFNCKAFLDQCLKSVFNQTFSSFEVIIVDDGSSDGTHELAKLYSNRYSQFSIHQQNHSYAGAARNLGISKASGDYILFLDGDDYFEPTLLEKAYARITETDADICCFKARSLNNETGKISDIKHSCRTELCPTSSTFNRISNSRYLYCFTTPAPWTKMFKRSFIEENNLRFQEIRSANDFCFVHTALSVANKITVLDECLVTYRQHNSTSLQATQGKDPFAFYQALTALLGELEQRGLHGELRHTFENTALDFCMYNLRTLRYDPEAQRKVFDFLKSTGLKELGIANKPKDYFYIYPDSRYSDYLLVRGGDFEQYRAATNSSAVRKRSVKERLRSIIPLRASTFEKSRKSLYKEIDALKEQNRDLSEKLSKCLELLQEMK